MNELANMNDKVRKMIPEMTMVTQGLNCIQDREGLFQAIRDFNTFTKDNDPYKEHDFGSLKWEGEMIFWKIDYWDGEFHNGCDPKDSECKRVITIMLSEEY